MPIGSRRQVSRGSWRGRMMSCRRSTRTSSVARPQPVDLELNGLEVLFPRTKRNVEEVPRFQCCEDVLLHILLIYRP